MCSTAAHQLSEAVRLWRSTYANRYRAVELNTFSRRNRMSHALLAREAEGLKRSSAAYLVSVRVGVRVRARGQVSTTIRLRHRFKVRARV